MSNSQLVNGERNGACTAALQEADNARQKSECILTQIYDYTMKVFFLNFPHKLL